MLTIPVEFCQKDVLALRNKRSSAKIKSSIEVTSDNDVPKAIGSHLYSL
jgi:hypothetical protein